MPGAIRENELPARGREVAVGDVDRNALFALGAEAVGEEREVGDEVAAAFARALHGVPLILENGFRVEEQAADERALAVVDIAAGDESEEVHGGGLKVSEAFAVFHRGFRAAVVVARAALGLARGGDLGDYFG